MNVEKHSQVFKWLVDIFGPNGIPEYEICERTIDVVHSIMKHNQECDEDCKMVIADTKIKCVQYKTEANRIEDILKDVSMTPSSFHPDVSGKLNALVDVSQQLEVQKVDVARLSIGMFELLKESTTTKNELSRTELEIDKLVKKVSSSSQVSEHLQKSLAHALNEVKVEKEKSSSYEEMVDLMRKKMKEYEEKNKHYETILSKSGFSASLTHEELQKKNEQLKVLREEFNELKAKLDSYHDLPTDPNLVAGKVSEAKARLNNLEETLNNHYQSMQ